MSNKRPLPMHEDDQGVSTVLGAILVAALTVMVLVTVRVNFVPEWDADSDSERISELTDSMAHIRATMDRQLDNPASTTDTVPVSLNAQGNQVSFFAQTKLGSTIAFSNGNSNEAELTAPLMVLRSQAQTSIEAVNEEWQTVSGSSDLFNVSEISHFRLRLTDPSSVNNVDEEGITAIVTDANSNFAGSIRFYAEDVSSDYAVNTEVTNAAGTIIYDDGRTSHHKFQPAYAWQDAMDQSVLFNQVFAAAEGPVKLTFVQAGNVQGDYAITYTEATPGGPVVVGESGITINNYAKSLTGGRLAIEWQPSELPEQTLVYEHGAVFRVQDDGAVIVMHPNIQYTQTNSGNYFALDMPMLAGDSISRTGGSVPINFIVQNRTTVEGTANSFTLSLATAYPALWAEVFNSAAAVGSVPTTHYSVTFNATHASITLDGPSTDPSERDVSLKIRQASIKTTFPS